MMSVIRQLSMPSKPSARLSKKHSVNRWTGRSCPMPLGVVSAKIWMAAGKHPRANGQYLADKIIASMVKLEMAVESTYSGR